MVFYPLVNMTSYNDYIIYIILIIRKPTFLILCVLLSFSAFSQNQAEIQLANEYLLKGDKKKAAELYRDLSKNDANVHLIHNNYINLLIDLGSYDEAHAYLKIGRASCRER